MPDEYAEWKAAREALLDEIMSPGGLYEERASVDLEGFGTITLETKGDPESGAFDGDDDCHGTLHWPGSRWDEDTRRPSGVDGSGRKFDTRSGPVWWMPPPDVKGDPKILEQVAERARRWLSEDWFYVGVILRVDRPFEESTDTSLWRIESDIDRASLSEIVDDLFSDLPPAPPLDPVWIVVRGEGEDVTLDVFNNEAAAREQASRLEDETFSVGCYRVAASAHAPVVD